MSDDIAVRLRQELPCWCDAEPTRIEVRDMCWEASAEIERLRIELAMAQKWRDNFQLAFEKERKNTEYWYGVALTKEQKNG